MTLNRDKLGRAAYRCLKAVLGTEDPELRKGSEDLKALASRLAKFWEAEANGDQSGRFMDAAEVNARALCMNTGLDKKGLPVRVAKALRALGASGVAIFAAMKEEETDGQA